MPEEKPTEEPDAREARSTNIFDVHHPVIGLVVPLLPLASILALEQVCRSLKQSIRRLTGPFWDQRLGEILPFRHPVLWDTESTNSRAAVSLYSSTQKNLRADYWLKRCPVCVLQTQSCVRPTPTSRKLTMCCRYVYLQQILTVSVSPDDTLVLLVGDSGSFQGFVKLYDVCSGGYAQSCHSLRIALFSRSTWSVHLGHPAGLATCLLFRSSYAVRVQVQPVQPARACTHVINMLSLLGLLLRLVQFCVVSPIWTALNHDMGAVLPEPVHWSDDSQSGLVLVRGRGGYNHVVSFGPDHLAVGQVSCSSTCCCP